MQNRSSTTLFISASAFELSPPLFSLLIPLNEIFHVALSYLRMYACGPGTLWGEHPSEQVESIVQDLGHNI